MTLQVSSLDALTNLVGSPVEAMDTQSLIRVSVRSLFISSFALIFFLIEEMYPSAGFSQGEYGLIVTIPTPCKFKKSAIFSVLWIEELSQTRNTLFGSIKFVLLSNSIDCFKYSKNMFWFIVSLLNHRIIKLLRRKSNNNTEGLCSKILRYYCLCPFFCPSVHFSTSGVNTKFVNEN